jgi:hypothetical protein
VEPPTALPAQLYLLAYDLGRQRLAPGSELGLVVRAGALEELRLSGIITDDRGKVRVPAPRQLTDPILNGVLREISDSRPRTWQYWVSARERPTLRAVRDDLDSRRYIRVEHRRVLGIFPWTTVTPREPRIIQHLQETVLTTLADHHPVTDLDPRTAALISFANTAALSAVLPRALRRVHKGRIAEVIDRVQPVTIALRKAIRAKQAAAAGG